MHVAVQVEVGTMSTIGEGGERILSIVEMSRNAEAKSGVPEQQVVIYQKEYSVIFVVPCIMLNSEIIPTRCNNCEE